MQRCQGQKNRAKLRSFSPREGCELQRDAIELLTAAMGVSVPVRGVSCNRETIVAYNPTGGFSPREGCELQHV